MAGILTLMKGQLAAIIEEAPEGGYWAVCPEVPGANGQGATVKEAKESLRAAIRLIFEDRRADAPGAGFPVKPSGPSSQSEAMKRREL